MIDVVLRQPLKKTISDNDCVLLTQLSKGSNDAFETMYRRYWRELYDEAYARLRNAQQSEDIVQDIFVSIWTRRTELKIANLSAYLHTAVRFSVFSYVSREMTGTAFFEPFHLILNAHTSADDCLLRKDMADLIRLYAETLPVKRKEIFLLHLSESVTTREMALRLHISQKTVQNQLGKALQGLRQRIAHLGILLVCLVWL